MQAPVEKLDASLEELQGLVEQTRAVLSADGYRKLKAGIDTLGYVTKLVENQEATIAGLRKLLCPASTEKTAKVLEKAGLCGGEKTGQVSGPEDHLQPPGLIGATGPAGRKTRARPRTQWSRCIRRSAKDRGSARVLEEGGCLPVGVRRQALSVARTQGAAADSRTSSDCRYPV